MSFRIFLFYSFRQLHLFWLCCQFRPSVLPDLCHLLLPDHLSYFLRPQSLSHLAYLLHPSPAPEAQHDSDNIHNYRLQKKMPSPLRKGWSSPKPHFQNKSATAPDYTIHPYNKKKVKPAGIKKPRMPIPAVPYPLYIFFDNAFFSYTHH